MPDTPAYQVLARKYRPETFADLVGQDAMVRTLKNAFAVDRIAQAFVMTGIYVKRANGEFDRMNQEILDEVQK